MFNLNSYLKSQKRRIDHALESLLKTADKPDRILEAMTYSLMAGASAFDPYYAWRQPKQLVEILKRPCRQPARLRWFIPIR